jgi:hypothetical protein
MAAQVLYPLLDLIWRRGEFSVGGVASDCRGVDDAAIGSNSRQVIPERIRAKWSQSI